MKPNILFILADDMGYGDFSAFNGGLSSTPTLDALSRESLCLGQHYTASPICSPARASLMTGRYPHRTGVIDTISWRGLDRLALRERTVADVLKTAGYVTGLVGKWHLGDYDPRYHPVRRGFREVICFGGGEQDYYDWRLEYNKRVVRCDGRYLTDVWTEEAVGFIERHRSEPFFLCLTYNAPHSPLQAPADEIKPFAETGKFNRGVSTLYGMLHRMDSGIARVLETLEKLDLAENTIVMFTSDNGPELGGRGEDCLMRFNCGLHGSKLLVYEGGIRLPMLVRWPAGLPGAGTVDDMTHFSDWLPTILAMADVEVPRDLKLDGVNALPALRGERGKTCTKRFWQWNRYTPLVTCNAAVRDGDWKLVRPAIDEAMKVFDAYPNRRLAMCNPEHFIENGLVRDPEPERSIPAPPQPELYNLADDPLEQNNLARQCPDRTGKLLRDLENWFEEVEAERASIDDVW